MTRALGAAALALGPAAMFPACSSDSPVVQVEATAGSPASAAGTSGDAGEAPSNTTPGGAAGAAASGGVTSPASGGVPGGSAGSGGGTGTSGSAGTAGDTATGGDAGAAASGGGTSPASGGAPGGSAGAGGTAGAAASGGEAPAASGGAPGGSAGTAGDTGTGGDVGTGGAAGAPGDGGAAGFGFPAGCACQCPNDSCSPVLVTEECFCAYREDWCSIESVPDELPWEECALNGCEAADEWAEWAWWLEYPDCDRVVVHREGEESDTRLFEASTGTLLGAENCGDTASHQCGGQFDECWGTGQVIPVEVTDFPFTDAALDGCLPTFCDSIRGTCPEGTVSRFDSSGT